MTRLVQLKHPQAGRRIAVVEKDRLQLIQTHQAIYDLAIAAMASGKSLEEIATSDLSGQTLDYDPLYRGESDWRLLPAFDHPDEPARCLVAGTGLTHKASAENRQTMHAGDGKEAAMTDSMRMYEWGIAGGRPASGNIGAQPEWFYKGCGTILRAHGEPLEVPSFAEDGGEEAEVAGAYLVDDSGEPRRIGLVAGNEFSDHVMEEKNYLYLAPSKLRSCAIGPELIVAGQFDDVPGTVRIERAGKTVWSHPIRTGEQNMSHTVANLEHHHFKHAAHRRPGDAHIYFFGADAFSFGAGIKLVGGDVMEIAWQGFGRPLRNPIRIDRTKPRFVRARPL